MTIENINMAVPVGRDPVPVVLNDPAAAELASEAAELESLTHGLLQAIRKRDKTVWSQKARARQQNQFDVEIKGLVKRLATSIASVIPDRQGRSDIRVRIYSDLIAMLSAASKDITSRSARRQILRHWMWSVGGALFTGLLILDVVLLWPHIAFS
jgi:hypothetical protein